MALNTITEIVDAIQKEATKMKVYASIQEENIRTKVKSTFNIAALFFVYLTAAEVFAIFNS